MKSRPSLLRLALVCALSIAQFTTMPNVASAAGTRVTVPDGTLVELSTLVDLSALTVINTKFMGTVKKDVVVNGFIIIRAGAIAQGTVIDSHFTSEHGDTLIVGGHSDIISSVGGVIEKPKRTGVFTTKAGDVKFPPFRIRLDWVTGVDGLKLALGDITTDGGDNGNPAQTIASPSYLIQVAYQSEKRSIFNLGPAVIHRTGDEFIHPNQIFTARIKGPVHIVTSLKPGDPGTDDGFAH